MICACEVGNVMIPMTSAQIRDRQETIREAWEAAATEHDTPDIRFLYEEGEPYLTAWDNNLCNCRHDRILREVFHVPGQPRTAQAFLCSMPGDANASGIDVINVHAPSGTPRLTDAQRYQLVRNLLLYRSISRATQRIGNANCAIGGDE